MLFPELLIIILKMSNFQQKLQGMQRNKVWFHHLYYKRLVAVMRNDQTTDWSPGGGAPLGLSLYLSPHPQGASTISRVSWGSVSVRGACKASQGGGHGHDGRLGLGDPTHA